jgi:hypothetical protein
MKVKTDITLKRDISGTVYISNEDLAYSLTLLEHKYLVVERSLKYMRPAID